jgi:hypothetical protein
MLLHPFGADHPPGYWHHLWPDPAELVAIIRDPDRRVPVPKDLVGLYAPDARDLDILCRDPRWALWVWNPNLDMIVPGPGAPHHQWANMCLTPLHAPCMAAVRALGPAMIQRVRHGEVAPSPRARYVSHRAFE